MSKNEMNQVKCRARSFEIFPNPDITSKNKRRRKYLKAACSLISCTEYWTCFAAKIFPPFLICRYHGNTLSTTVKKCVLHIYTFKANICAKFHENWWKTEEASSRRKIFPRIFAIICRYQQHTFYHCQKMCLAHSTPRHTFPMRIGDHWGSSSRRKILRNSGNTLSVTVEKFLHSRQHLCQISWELAQKLRKLFNVSRRKIGEQPKLPCGGKIIMNKGEM